LRDLGLGDYRLRTPFGRPASRLAHWLKFKRFQYFSAMSDSIVFGCALAHLRHTGMVLVHVHHLREGSDSLDGCAVRDSPMAFQGRSCGFACEGDAKERIRGGVITDKGLEILKLVRFRECTQELSNVALERIRRHEREVCLWPEHVLAIPINEEEPHLKIERPGIDHRTVR